MLVTDLELIDDKRFIMLQKWIPALCLFLTGKTPKGVPLARTPIFETMRERVKVTVAELIEGIQGAMSGAPVGVDKATADRALSLVCKDATRQTVRTKRSHHAPKYRSMLPSCGVVYMNVGTPPWAPIGLFAPAAANASMEATAENFKAIFDIV